MNSFIRTFKALRKKKSYHCKKLVETFLHLNIIVSKEFTKIVDCFFRKKYVHSKMI